MNKLPMLAAAVAVDVMKKTKRHQKRREQRKLMTLTPPAASARATPTATPQAAVMETETEIMTKPARVETDPLPKPKDHGEICPPTAEPNLIMNGFTGKLQKVPTLPRMLRSVTTGLPYDKAKEKYLLWRIFILQDCKGPGGVNFRKGDTATVTGDVAHELVRNFLAEIEDPKVQEEEEIIKKAEKLGLPPTVREIVAEARRKPNRPMRSPGPDIAPLPL